MQRLVNMRIKMFTVYMTEKYKNKYRIKTTRLQNWNYGNNGIYFITICTKNRENYFGEIVNGEMKLSKIGIIEDIMWHEIKNHTKYIELGEFVVMPNHIHGILIIDKPDNNDMDNDNNNDNDVDNDNGNDADTNNDMDMDMDNDAFVETRLIASLPSSNISLSFESNPPKGGITGNKNPMFHENISRVIRWYKGRCSFEIHKINPYFNWQPRFYDHIIRNENKYLKISQYIINNPQN